jgi:predicted nucleic acid-binding protein
VLVADTAPLNYLILIRAVDLLPKLYGHVVIPSAVHAKLAHPSAPNLVRDWIAHPPDWLVVELLDNLPPGPWTQLHSGERQAIFLALQPPPALLLMDERDGVGVARSCGLSVTGTLGFLDAVSTRGWIDLRVMFERLQQTTFRPPLRVMAHMLEQDAQRKRP